MLGHAVDALVARDAAGGWIALAAGLIALGVACDLVDTYAGPRASPGRRRGCGDRLVRHVLAVGPDAVAGSRPATW